MGWLVAIVVVPVLFMVVAVCTVLKLAALMLRLILAPVRLLALRR
jgi:hypothetical protein